MRKNYNGGGDIADESPKDAPIAAVKVYHNAFAKSKTLKNVRFRDGDELREEFPDRLDTDDEEHNEVWLTQVQSSRTLSCFPCSKGMFYHISDEYEYNPRHLTDVYEPKCLNFGKS